jgi:hypothetical protein
MIRVAAKNQRVPKRKDAIIDTVPKECIPAIKAEIAIAGRRDIYLGKNIFKKYQRKKKV